MASSLEFTEHCWQWDKNLSQFTYNCWYLHITVGVYMVVIVKLKISGRLRYAHYNEQKINCKH